MGLDQNGWNYGEEVYGLFLLFVVEYNLFWNGKIQDFWIIILIQRSHCYDLIVIVCFFLIKIIV